MNGKERKCKVPACGKTMHSRGWCKAHYTRWWRYGDPNFKKRHVWTGNSSHPLYPVYDSMKGRCFNKNDKGYKNYGGRGITVCKRWLGADGFDSFIKDMGERPDGFTLERIDNSSDYEPSNCKWASWIEQGGNKRNSNQDVGVSRLVVKGRWKYWQAQIKRSGVTKYLGTFKEYDQAVAARKRAETEVEL